MDGMIVTAVSAAGAVAGYVGQRVMDAAVDKLAAAVIRPCAERRAHAYFHKLAEALGAEAGEEASTGAIGAALDRVMERDSARETVYEFYRQSVLSRSKEVGPRLLALLAARLVREDRQPTAAELQVAEIAEACTDDDLAQFVAYFATITGGTSPKHAERVRKVPAGYLVRLDQETSDSNWPSAMRAGPLNLASELGAWAAKFERAGAVEQHIETNSEEYKEDSERHIDMPGVLHRIEWSAFFGDACHELADLIPLATPRVG
jgi:hypothetical protein